MINVPNDDKDPVPPQSSRAYFSQNPTSFTELKNSLQGSNASLKNELEIQETSSIAFSTVIRDSKTPPKNKISAQVFSESP